MAGLDIPEHLPGRSFAPLMQDPALEWKTYAISQYSRGGNADFGGTTMGYSMRTREWRYVEWIDRRSGEVVDRKLYSHVDDTRESTNVAGQRKHRQLIRELSAQLHATLNAQH